MVKPLVALVGRPNVGKSTLFNRLIGQRTAITSETAGTTRDRVTAEATWAGSTFVLIDTGGLDVKPTTDLWERVQRQAEAAIAAADVIVLLVDASTGVTAADRDVADLLRSATSPVILAANKADSELRRQAAFEFYELGLGDPQPVSAYHNVGVDDLMARVIGHFPKGSEPPEVDADLKLVIVGRTNVGKSQLLNAITGQERAIVSEVPGTTRDALDTMVRYDDRSLLLIDTAGIRRRGRIEPGIERYSALRSIRAIDRADVALLLLDASELATAQDAHIAKYVLDAYKGLVLAVNKWDLSGSLGLTKEEARRRTAERFRFAPYAPVCFISALGGSGIDSLLNVAWRVSEVRNKGVPRYELGRVVSRAVEEHPPATSGRHALKIYSVAQDDVGPPTFTFYVNRADMVHFSYQRYLENKLREAYGFEGSPLRFHFKGRRKK